MGNLKPLFYHPVKIAMFVFAIYSTGQIAAQDYETRNDECGGVFRNNNASINFTFNNRTYTGQEPNKTCVWTISPRQMYRRYTFKLTKNTLNCGNSDIAVTGFQENNARFDPSRVICNEGTTFNVEGVTAVVVLVSQNPNAEQDKGFTLTWEPLAGDQPINDHIRYVTAYNSYGRSTQQPLPYFAANYLGNSLATWAFPKANGSTEGFTMRINFSNVTLHDSKYPYNGTEFCPPDNTLYPDCEFLMLCQINQDASLTTTPAMLFTDKVLAAPVEFINKFGFYFVMWGGNFWNATGGGAFTLTYNFIRG